MVFGAHLAEIGEQLDHCVDGRASHASRAANGVPFTEGSYDLGLALGAQPVHTDYIIDARSSIVKGEGIKLWGVRLHTGGRCMLN